VYHKFQVCSLKQHLKIGWINGSFFFLPFCLLYFYLSFGLMVFVFPQHFLQHRFLQVTAFIKACKEQIDILKDSINNEEANTKGWLGIKADTSNADTIAHKHGVV
jgi:hypothetical protein